MAEQGFEISRWVEKLTTCLRELVDYENWIEQQFLHMRHRVQIHLGLPGNAPRNSSDYIRERISRYSLRIGREGNEHSGYQREISSKLGSTLDVLLEHPVVAQAVCSQDRVADCDLLLGLDMGVYRVSGHQIIFILRGLVDYAFDHSPEEAAGAFSMMVQRGNDRDLISYSILPFRGLHVEAKHNVSGDLSIISFEEARQYISPGILAHSLVGESNGFRGMPIGAVVWEVKWGPVFLPAGSDLEADWPELPATFRDDALMLVDLLAVTHESAVISPGWTTQGVERWVEHLVGRKPFSNWTFPGQTRSDDFKGGTTSPSVSMDKLTECADLFSRLSNDDLRLRSALSRLAASLSRVGPLAAFDSVVDVTIALEILYQAGSEQSYRYATRAAYFLEESAQSRKEVYETVKSLYDARSSIVHGRSRPRGDEASLQGAWKRGFDVARRTLIKLALEGGPSKSSDWDGLVIAGGST